MKILLVFLILASAAYSAPLIETTDGNHAVIAQCDGSCSHVD